MIVLPFHCILGKVDDCYCQNSKHCRCALVPCSHISRYLRNSPNAVGVVGVEPDCVALYWSNSRSFFAGAGLDSSMAERRSLQESGRIQFLLSPALREHNEALAFVNSINEC